MTDYPTYITQLENMIAMDPVDADFQTIIPAVINYAEMRIYRELDLISTITRDLTTVTAAGHANTALPNTFVVVHGLNLLTASTVTGAPPYSTSTAMRVPLAPVSKEVFWALWGDPNVTGQPTQFAMVDQWTALLGPSPDAIYGVEVYGTQRPTPLSATNTTTFLTTWLYDVFLAASMVFVSGWMRNFGAQSSDPQMSSSWEAQYQTLKGSANLEELRKKAQADAWTANAPTPVATPRG